MEISVIISTYQGKHKLPCILKALEKQTHKNFELLVVIDGSTDGSKEWLELQKTSFSNFKIIEQQNKGRAAVRNAGATRATGRLLIFYDDDMEPYPDSVANHLKHHEIENLIIGGNQVEYYHENKTDIQNYKASLSLKWMKPYQKGLNAIGESNLFLTAANFSIRKEFFLKLGGFDERLRDAEDQDLAYRALETKSKIFFDTLNIAVHHDSITMTSYIKRLRQYRNAHLQLQLLYPQRYALKKESAHWKKKMYRLFAMPLFPKIVDSNWNLFLIFPKRIRYRIYDITIQALGIEHRQVKI